MRAARTLKCEMCGAPSVESPVPADPFDPGAAGGSARLENERRRAKDLEDFQRRYPRTWRLRTRRKQTTDSWGRGSEGEQRVGKLLDSLRPDGIVAFHDRRVGGSRWNIDHVAVARSGIHVIDAKLYSAKRVRLVTSGGFSNRKTKLFVGRRDCTKLVDKMSKQILAVDRAAGDLVRTPPTAITAVLCFVGGEFDLIGPHELMGVRITGLPGLRKLLRREGPLGDAEIDQIAHRVADRLPPA